MTATDNEPRTMVAVSDLTPLRVNPRRGNVATLVASLQSHGQYRPLVVNRPTMEVLAGNHTLAAARELGWDEVAVFYVDVDEAEARKIALIDNRASDIATYDDAELAELLSSLDDLDGTGFAAGDLDALLEGLRDTAVGEDRPADTSPQLGAVEYRLIVHCTDEQQQAQWLRTLQEEGLEVHAVAL